MPPIRLLIADDHMLMREGLRTVLSEAQDIEIVGEARTGEEAVALAHQLEPDVILMDLKMPGKNGIEATHEIVSRRPHIRVVALTAHMDEQNIIDIVRAGAAGIWSKDVEYAELVEVIRSAQAGKRPIHADAVGPLMQARRASYIDRLSDRERDVLALLNEGFTNREIAQRLSISEATVKGHVSHILAKLGMKNRAQLALFAERNKDRNT